MFFISELLKSIDVSYELLTKVPEPRIGFVTQTDITTEKTFNATEGLCICFEAGKLLKQLKEVETVAGCAALIIADEKDTYLSDLKDAVVKLSGAAVYYISHVEDIQSVFSRIQHQIYEQYSRAEQLLNVEYRTMVNLLARGADLNEIETYAYKLLGNPMIVTDESFKVLIHTGNSQVDDPVWQEIVTNAYSPVALQEKTNVNNFWERLERSPLPLFVDDEAFEGLMKRAVAKIRVGSETKGYIALLEARRRINRIDLYVLQMLAEVFSVKIKEDDTILRAKGQLRNEFSSDLLTGNITSEHMIHNRALSLGLHFGECMCVLCVQARDEQIYIGPELDRLRAALRLYSDLCIYTFDGSHGYFILSFDCRQKWRRLISKALESVLSQRRMIGLLSTTTGKSTELHLCYEQTERLKRLLPKIVKPSQNLYFYGQLTALDIIGRAFTDAPVFMNSEAYQTLLNFDRRDGTEYIATLRCFFSSNQSVSETSKRLFIHRNTVNYRLNRIRELLEEDFDDPLIRLHLQMSILSNDLN